MVNAKYAKYCRNDYLESLGGNASAQELLTYGSEGRRVDWPGDACTFWTTKKYRD